MADEPDRAFLVAGAADAQPEQHDDDEDEQHDEGGGQDRRRGRQGEGIPLENLLRLLVGQRAVVERRAVAVAGSNEDLIAGLKRSGMLTSEAVTRAMLLVPRGSFVPEEHAAEAWVDSPIRVERHDYNISAPHMHAQMLESLNIGPGDRVCDVGCGCGFLTAAAAVLAGRSGSVVGVDIKEPCIHLSRSNVARLTATSSEYASAAAAASFLKANIFIPHPGLKGRFNKVVAGATVPHDKLHLLLHLLEPGGGQLLAPVDSELRLYTRAPDGRLRQRLVSSVRFSDLQVPSDASIALAVLEDEAAAAMAVTVSPSTLAHDLPHGLHKGSGAGGFMALWNCCSPAASASPGSSPGSLVAPDTPVINSSSANNAAANSLGRSGSDDVTMTDALGSSGGSSSGSEQPAWQQVLQGLREPDCELQGAGWTLQAHKTVLKSRAAHFKAKLSSSMRDADDTVHKVPEGFSRSSLEALLLFLYRDELADGLEPADVVQLLHVAAYYGTPRLIELCEARLVDELRALPAGAAAAEAPHLLLLGDELGLVQLTRAAVAFIAQHYDDVTATEAWQCLDRSQVALVASALASQLGRLKGALADLEPPSEPAGLPKRRSWW